VFPGIVLPLKPFFGSMGVAPRAGARTRQQQPAGQARRQHGQRELVAGSTLWIPVFVPGALFEVGDGHAAQGDGEVDQTAIETSLRGKLQLTVRKGMALTWPRAETETDYISMATDPDLRVAMTTAVQEMVDFLAATKGLTKRQAYQLTSHGRPRRGHADRRLPNVGVHVKDAQEHFQEMIDLLKARAARRSRVPHGDGARIALAIEGGAMRGVVSAGMVAALEQLGLTDAFDAVYGSSAGAINGAYFLAGQANLGVTIYSEDINNRHFIDLRRR
jgi:hypothetical protein